MAAIKRTRELQFYFCLAIISVIILMWFISPLFYPDTWKGYFQQEDPDSLLFTRQLEQSLLKGKVLTTDNYAAFPYETPTGFAPFYMWFLFSFINIVFYLFPTLQIDPIYIASILPIIIPWFTTIFLLLSIYKLSNDKVLTLFCSFCLLPGFSAAMISGFMKLDYDFIISFFIWAWIILGAFFIKTEKHTYIYAGAVITALFISTWTGAPFFYFFACLYGLLLWFYNPKNNDCYLTYASTTMLIGSIVALFFVPITEDTFRNCTTANIARYSHIQGILVFLGSLFLILLNKISTFKNSKKIGLLLFGIFAFFFILFFHEALHQASGILFQKDPVHFTIGELNLGFNFNKIFDGGIKDFILQFTPLLLFLPICYFFPLKQTEKKGLRFLQHWIMLLVVLSVFYQIRYIRWIGCGYGLAIGFTSYYLWKKLKIISSSTTKDIFKLTAALLPLNIIVLSINYSSISSSYKIKPEELELFSWIKEQTPPTSGYYDDNKPEYGILAYWDKGNKISFYTKRPVCVSNSLWGYKTMADVYSSINQNDSFSLCQKLKIKYLVFNPSSSISKNILNYWPILKDMPETPEYKLYYDEIPSREKYDYFYIWMADHFGLTPLGDFTYSEHFRIVFANKNDGNTISKNVMFEVVEGAKLDFNTEPNSNISLSLEFKLGEMTFIYKVNKIADENGYCQYILPYSNGYDSGNIITDPFYKVSIEKDGKRTLAKLFVTDSDVVEGNNIDLSKQFEVVEQ